MDRVAIEYRIKFAASRTEVFKFELHGSTFDLVKREVRDPPRWTKLTFNQCSHCPLNDRDHSHCPAALQLCDIVERFHDTRSIDKVELEVVTEERRVIQTLDIQRAISSMLDLILPICGCPKTAHFKPLACFHLPLASEEETVFRVTGMYLLAQYFLSQMSSRGRISLEGLIDIFTDLHILHKALASRLQSVTQSDSVKNAFALVDVYSVLVPSLIEDQLVEMRGFFESYLPDLDVDVAPPKRTHLEKAKAFKLELVPLEGGAASGDDRPRWLKEATGDSELKPDPEPAKAGGRDSGREEKRMVIEKILSKSDLALELEPISEEDPPGLDRSNGSPADPKPSKSVFKLADD